MRNNRCSGTLIQSRFGTRGNFELVMPAPHGEGMVHYTRNNDHPTLLWGGPLCFGERPVSGISLIQSDFGTYGLNLAVAAREGDDLVFYTRDDTLFNWRGPVVVFTGIAGVPSLVQDETVPRRSVGTPLEEDEAPPRGDFHVVVPLAGGGLGHFRRHHAVPSNPWTGLHRFGTGSFEGVSMIQNQSLGEKGNLEVLAQQGDRLLFFWWNAASDTWHEDGEIAGGIGGVPTLIQTYHEDEPSDFEAVVPLAGGGLAHFTRDNHARGFPWRTGATFGRGRPLDLGLVQSNFGAGDLEVTAREDERIVHYLYERATDTWQGPFAVGVEHADNKAECIFRWRAAYLQEWARITVRIQLVPDEGITEAELAELRDRWRQGIVEAWSDHYGCRSLGRARRTLRFEVEWTDDKPHHTVRVRRGRIRSNKGEWSTNASGRIAAHEFGHMLGQVDEYPEPEVCPDRKPVFPATIMGNPYAPVAARQVEALCLGLCRQQTVRVLPILAVVG